jgi:ATP-binding cassette subfamily B protein
MVPVGWMAKFVIPIRSVRRPSACLVMPPTTNPSAPTARPDNSALLWRMTYLAWQYRWGCVRLIIEQLLLLSTALAATYLTGLGIDVIRYHADGMTGPLWLPPGLDHWLASPPQSQVAVIAGLLLGVALLRAVLNYRYAVDSAILIQRRIVVDLRAAVYDRMQRLGFLFFDSQATGSIINRVTSDVQAVRAFVDGVIIQGLILVLSLIVYLVYMLKIHVGLTIATLATTPLLWWATLLFSRKVRPEYDRNRELVDQMVLTLAENVQGVHVIKGFHREPEEIAKFQRDSEQVRDQQRSIFWKVSVFTPTIGFLTQVNLAVLLGYGGYLVTQDQLPLGTGLVVFAGLLQQFSGQVANMTNIANSVQQALSAAHRVFEVLDMEIEIASPPGAIRAGRFEGNISFEDVSFGYRPESIALAEVRLEIPAGQVLGVLGATGAGKSTLLSLIPRFYDPRSGAVRIDGVDVRDYNLDDLRRNIGIVFQESFLFSNSVSANIAFGQPLASQEQIIAAATTAGADEFIRALPKGYDTILGEFGLDLSGGQRQRIALARALLLDPAILLLDDPTAAIDPHTEGEILAAMQSAMRGRTTVIVAHRLSALRSATRIIVLEEGKVVQMGTHAELLLQAGHYREAALVQGVL